MREREKREERRCNLSETGKEKMRRSVPGSIYLPGKHFPTKQKYQQETAERDNPEDSLKHTKEQLIFSKEKKNAMFISLPEIFVYRLQNDVHTQEQKRNIACRCVKEVQVNW